jgi:serine/threonine protein kinase
MIEAMEVATSVCLDDETVAALLRGEASPSLDRPRDHLLSCEVCQDLVALAAPRTGLGTGDVIAERYRVGAQIGRGGMGIVYRAWDEKLARELAIKVLHSADPSAHDRMNREAQTLARLSHPNIVTVFDVAVHAGQLCMVMELATGTSLRAWLATRPPRAAVLGVLSKAAEGLSAAHRAGLIHRDFKPENVMVGADGQVKICDFGLAQGDVVGASAGAAPSVPVPDDLPLRRLTRTGKLVGTPAYMAPEQFAGRDASERSDQFAFAVCAWEALFDAHPFGAETLGGLRRNFDRGPRGAPGGRLDPTRRAIERALALRPEDRHESMVHLLAAMHPAEHRGRWRRSVAFVVAAVVLVGGLIVAAASRTTHAPVTSDGQGRQAHDDAPARSSFVAAPSASGQVVSVEPSPPPATSARAAASVPRARPSGASPVRPQSHDASSRARATSTADVPSISPKGPNGAPLIE